MTIQFGLSESDSPIYIYNISTGRKLGHFRAASFLYGFVCEEFDVFLKS